MSRIGKKTIDIPVIPPDSKLAVTLVAEDEFGFVERISIYNLKRENNKIGETYQIGCRFAIINPYIRLAMDGKPMIRVDDPKSIIFYDKTANDICRFCGKENSKYKCSKCQIAKYCCKEFQLDDWKIFKHVLICNS